MVPIHRNVVRNFANIEIFDAGDRNKEDCLGWITIMEICDSNLWNKLKRGNPTLHERKKIAEGIFSSVLMYCLPLYGGCDVEHIKAIQVLQNKAAQIVCNAPPRSRRVPLYDSVGWLTVNQLISYHTLISVFKLERH